MWRGPLHIAAFVGIGAACLGWQSPSSQRFDEVAYLKKRTLDAVKKCERLAESEKALKLRVESLESMLHRAVTERTALQQKLDECMAGPGMARAVVDNAEAAIAWRDEAEKWQGKYREAREALSLLKLELSECQTSLEILKGPPPVEAAALALALQTADSSERRQILDQVGGRSVAWGCRVTSVIDDINSTWQLDCDCDGLTVYVKLSPPYPGSTRWIRPGVQLALRGRIAKVGRAIDGPECYVVDGEAFAP